MTAPDTRAANPARTGVIAEHQPSPIHVGDTDLRGTARARPLPRWAHVALAVRVAIKERVAAEALAEWVKEIATRESQLPTPRTSVIHSSKS